MLYNVQSKTEKELLALDTLEDAAVPAPEPQQFDWQNRHVAESSLEWSPSGKNLLISVRGDLFWFAVESGKWEQFTATPRTGARCQAFARRHARRVPARSRSVRAGNRVAQSYAADRRRQRDAAQRRTGLGLSRGAGAGHGLLVVAGFQAHRLSAVRYQPRIRISAGFAHRRCAPSASRSAIPKPARPTPSVHVGVVSADGGNTRWMDLGDTRDALIARVYWTPDSSKLADRTSEPRPESARSVARRRRFGKLQVDSARERSVLDQRQRPVPVLDEWRFPLGQRARWLRAFVSVRGGWQATQAA